MTSIPIHRVMLERVWDKQLDAERISQIESEFNAGTLPIYGRRAGKTEPEQVPYAEYSINWIGPSGTSRYRPCAERPIDWPGAAADEDAKTFSVAPQRIEWRSGLTNDRFDDLFLSRRDWERFFGTEPKLAQQPISPTEPQHGPDTLIGTTVSFSVLKDFLQQHGIKTEGQLMAAAQEKFRGKQVPRSLVRKAIEQLWGLPGRVGRPKKTAKKSLG